MPKKSTLGSVRNVRAAVVKNSVHDVFANRLKRAAKFSKKVVIASPWISSDGPGATASRTISDAIRRHQIPTYIFTRTPQRDTHRRALARFAACPSVEIVLNDSLHAKIYACLAPYPYGFALLGSANMTDGASQNYEVGLVVLASGGGERTVRELASFGLDYLRTRPESMVLKRISPRRD